VREFLIVAGLHLLSVISPGPDFAMVLRNSLVYSRRSGIRVAIGLGLGILVHVTYSIVGIALIISRSIVLFNAIKLLGAGYLIYIGVRALVSSKPAPPDASAQIEPDDRHMTTLAAIRTGFLTNVLNPKASLFFLALFTQVISPHTPVGIKVLYGVEMSLMTIIWFSFVAISLTQKPVRKVFRRIQHRIERVFGVALIALGLKIALTEHN
jgi:RhtB (resistance to homoserine/threonine) family protein